MSAHGGPLPTEKEILRLATMASNENLDEVSPNLRKQALMRLVDAALRLRYAMDGRQS